MSRLLDFYRGEATDSEGRRLTTIRGWSDDRLEEVHDFIQWLFPLPEPSNFNPDAPLLTVADIAAFQGDATLRAELDRSFVRFLTFLGLMVADGKVVEAANFADRIADVWGTPNHNWLRISRVLRCLHLLGLDARARAFFEYLDAHYQARRFPIPENTYRYWAKAVGEA